ncbi:hypothetical protein M5K25_013658 [Dendrobium thyrsiflorum]|uniref:Uncharacterized protein n=1 Tax=Dendrobium thyrsiflorum TaxID=117978 RepID=A0ABD0V0D7_DENTH
MEPPSQISCSGNCLVHLHSDAGKAWFQRHCPFPQYLGPDGIPRFLVIRGNNERKFLSAHEIHTFQFRSNIATYERLYGIRVQNVGAIIPASINPRQYQSQLSAAAADAGVCIVLFIERSVLAASYYKSLSTPGHRTALVFELGHHFLEISLLTDDRGLNVKAAVSDMGCPLFNHVVSALSLRHGNGFTSDVDSFLKIRMECERAKDALCLGSGTVEVKFNLLGRETRMPINREWLVRLNLDHLRSGIMRCLMEAGVRREAVNEVVLAGASSNIPAVRRVLHEFFQRQPFRCNIDPAHLIELSSRKCMGIVSTTLNSPVIALHAFNLGLHSL